MPESAPDVNHSGPTPPTTAPPPHGSAASANSTSAQLLAQRRQRLTSAKYYDIASTLLGGDTDIDELFVAAARDGDYDKIEHFLQGRTDVIVSIDVKDKQTGNTPLIWAAKKGHIKIVHLLLKHGADPTLHNYKDQTAVEVATPNMKTVLLDSVEKSTESPHRLLLQAAWQGNIKVVQKLLKENKVIDINCQNAEGLTPLLLLTRDMHLFEKTATHLHRPYSPVHVLQELLAHRANVHATDGDDKTCLHYASQSKTMLAQSVVSCLIDQGSEMDVRDKRYFMPIHCASKSGNTNVVVTLVEGGSEVNSRGYAGLTPLHITAYNDHHQTAKTLLQHGADVTLTDDSGLTAVDLAKSRKMKTTLREAWTEATDKKPATSLSPVRAPSREQSRLSTEGINNKRKGEVIFDGLQINAYTSQQGSPGQRPVLSRSVSNAEKARIAEQQMLREIETGRFTPNPKDNIRRLGLLRNKPPPLPHLSQSSMIPSSPDSLSPSTPGLPRPADDLRRSLEDGRHFGQKGRQALLSTSSSGLSSCKDKDVNFCIQNNRQHSHIVMEGSQLKKKHQRSGSDPFTASFGDVALSCDQYLTKKARSRSTSSQDDYDEDPLKMLPSDRELTGLNIPSTIPEVNSPRVQAVIVDSEGNPTTSTVIAIYPNSSRVLPPTPVPTFLTQKSFNLLDGKLIRHQDKEQSPRSNDELPKISHDPMKTINSTNLLRSHTIFKDEFILEESRPKDPLLQSSGSDPTSSASSLSSSSPRDTANIVLVHKNAAKIAKGRISPLIKCDIKRVSVSDKTSNTGQTVKTRTKVGRSQSFTTSDSKTVAVRKCSVPENAVMEMGNASSNSPSGLDGSEPTVSVKFSRSDSELNKKIGGLVPQLEKVKNSKGKNLTPPATAVVSQVTRNASGNVIAKNSGIKSSVNDKTKHLNVSVSKGFDNTKHSNTSANNTKHSNVSASVSRGSDNTKHSNECVGKSSDNTKHSAVNACVSKSSDNTKPSAVNASVSKSSDTTNRSAVNASVSKSSDNTKHSTVNASVSKSSDNTKHSNVSVNVNKSSDHKTPGKQDNPDGKCVPSDKTVPVVQVDPKADTKTEEENNTQNTAKCSSQSVSKPSSCVSTAKNTQTSSTPNRKFAASKTARMATSTSQNKTKFLKAFSTPTSVVKGVGNVTASTGQSSTKKKSEENNTGLTSQPVNSSLRESNILETSLAVKKENNVLISDSSCDVALVSKSNSNLHIATSGLNSMPVASTKSNTQVSTCDVVVVTISTISSTKNTSVTSSATSQLLNSSTSVTQSTQLSTSSEHVQPQTSIHGPSLSHKTSSPKGKLCQSVKKSASNTSSSNGTSLLHSKTTKSSANSGPNVTVSCPDSKSDNLKSPNDKIPSQCVSLCAVKVNGQESGLVSNNVSDKTVSSKLASTPKEPLVKILCNGEEPKTKVPSISAIISSPSQTIQTPLIVNPFEDMIVPEWNPVAKPVKNVATTHSNYKGVCASSFGFVVGKSSKDATCKLKSNAKCRNIKSAKKPQSNKDSKRPASSHRQTSARKHGVKTKTGDQDDGKIKVKSAKGKRVRSARRKKPDLEAAALTENALNPDVALISGIGWHVATNCFDTSDVKVAMILGSTDSEDSDLEVIDAEVPKLKHKPKLTERSASPGTPRFQEVMIKRDKKSSLPAMTNDGFPPMNLDMTQKPFSEVKLTEASSSPVPKKANSNAKQNKFASPFDDITNQVHKEIMLQKLSTIPQSPTFANNTDLAINHFDQMIKGDQLDKLLGIAPGESLSSCHSTTIRQGLRKEAPSGKRHSRKKKAEDNGGSSHQTASVSEEKVNADASSKFDDKNIAVGPELDREPTDAEITKIIQKYSKLKPANRLHLSRQRSDSIDSDDFDTNRTERKFSETKKISHESDSEIDEAIEEILNSTVGTSTLNSTFRSNRTVKSLNNTLTEADRSILLNLKKSDSVFHAKPSNQDDAKQSDDGDKKSSSKHSDNDDVFCSDTFVDETNPHLLKRFHDDNFHMGVKVKAMIDAGADRSKVKEMINADDEQKQLEKVMNYVRNMELQATVSDSSAKASSQATPRKVPPRPEQSMESPHRSKKPPSTHGLPPPGNKFLELKKGSVQRGEKTPPEAEDQSPRMGNKEVAVLEAISKEIMINPSEGETMRSHLRGRRGSRTSSAGTIDSLQSDADETIEWKKGNVLGRGAFGVVWCGLTSEGGLIAVKQIELNAADHHKAQREYEKVQEEVELLKNLRHKNIVGYLGTSFENDIVSIFMQFVPGGSIASILARFGALDESVFRRYTKQILEGVQYLHDNDIIHRDIKGGNVMLMPNGVIKLIDFGCAKRLCINLSLSQSQILKSMKGTPYWMAPEVVNETGHGKKSDIWSVGCTVFEMATKKPPWANVNPMAAIFAIGSDKPIPPLPEQFSDEARHFVKCCLTRDQNVRSSATELLEHPFILKKPASRK